MLREIDAMTAILARAGMLVMSWTLAAGAAAPAQLPQGAAKVDQKAIGLYQQASANWLSNGRT